MPNAQRAMMETHSLPVPPQRHGPTRAAPELEGANPPPPRRRQRQAHSQADREDKDMSARFQFRVWGEQQPARDC